MSDSAVDADRTQPEPYKDEELLRKLYLEEEMSMMAISEKIDCSPTTVRKYLDKFGVERRPAGEQISMAYGYDRYTVPLQVKTRGSVAWRPDAETTAYVHRLLAVSEWGVEAVAGNDVHHKNGVPWDNRIENLEIMSHGEHSSTHRKVSWLDRLRMVEMYRSGASTYDLGDVFDVSFATVLRSVKEFDEELVRDNVEASKMARERAR